MKEGRWIFRSFCFNYFCFHQLILKSNYNFIPQVKRNEKGKCGAHRSVENRTEMTCREMEQLRETLVRMTAADSLSYSFSHLLTSLHRRLHLSLCLSHYLRLPYSLILSLHNTCSVVCLTVHAKRLLSLTHTHSLTL